MIYFDTAYLLKCYIKESGWETVRALARQAESVACSIYGRMELHAAFHRKLREGEVSGNQLTVIFRQIDLDDSQHLWNWLSLTESIIVSAVSSSRMLPQSVFLRTAHAVHLMTAKTAGFSHFYPNDSHALAAAPYFGLEGKNIIDRCDWRPARETGETRPPEPEAAGCVSDTRRCGAVPLKENA